jgi:hypothetical protein
MEQILIQLRTALKLINMELNDLDEIELRRQLERFAELRDAQQTIAELIEDLQNENL